MKVTVQKAIEAITKCEGNITDAAKSVDVTRRHFYRLIDKHPKLKEALDDARESFKDLAEGQIRKKIKDGDTTMLIFFAKTQMKDRGYIERQEMDVTSGGESLGASLDKLISKAYGNQSD